jgi:hypothetical protein
MAMVGREEDANGLFQHTAVHLSSGKSTLSLPYILSEIFPPKFALTNFIVSLALLIPNIFGQS